MRTIAEASLLLDVTVLLVLLRTFVPIPGFQGLVRLAREHSAVDQAATVDGFFAWLRATVGGDEPANGGNVVELATFHAAKGLEWPVVFVVGLERGLVPIAQADTPAARAEERRLLYVAVTRAEHELHCSWAERRTFGGRTLRP